MPDYPLNNLPTADAEFQAAHPEFLAAELDDLRAREYSRLDELGHVYLDYTGGSLYSSSQLQQHMNLLNKGVYGNPHSSNPSSQAATQLDERAREYVMRYFNASPDEYLLIFTSNASGALKLVGESYPFGPGGQYLLTFDNHNSVNGIREFARARGAQVTYIPVVPPDLRMDADRLQALLDNGDPAYPNLFAYPGQSNFSGVQHSLEWIESAQANGWDVLLDVAAFAPTNRLDLSRWHPDFVSLSFYKIFGYPTGIGALIARKTAVKKLRRPWFAGGTITIASVQGDGYYLEEGGAAFEDGTIDYLNLPAVEIGLKHIESIGIDVIHDRVCALTGWLLDNLLSLRHANGQPLVRVYGPTDCHMRGGTIAVNLYDPAGKLIDYRAVEKLANQVGISLRTGCFCNPGAGEMAMGLTKADLEDCFHNEERMTFEQFITAMSGKTDGAVGAIRISVGLATTFEDVYRFLHFMQGLLNRDHDQIASL
ncbi:MAG: aminotransferase class V-fold PLP-dependent enzyme [Anaerolineae bacterium]|nr:aminotransferase class V-fold PLP-dependent enzyme [Anaerolineae bacterium]